MNDKKEIKNVGLGFVDALTLLFIALKLTGCITWSWIWVLSPMWISLGFLAVLAILIVLLAKAAE